ncbi:MAG: DUF3240 family protein [Gammaproteobacteria bacterium]
MSGDERVRLTLVFPPALEPALIDEVLAFTPVVPGFTTWTGEGHAAGFDRASATERVRGRVGRRMLTVVWTRARIDTLLAALRTRMPGTDVYWWIEPVLDSGSFR